MVRKTRKHSSAKSKKTAGIYSIPELRRSFEHIEDYVNQKIRVRESKEKLIKDLRKEWSKVFFKELDKKSAEAFVNDRLAKTSKSRHRTLRRKGGADALTGSPLSYTTRQGLYLAPGQIPDANGHLPLSNGAKSDFGSYVQYVDKGFWNPEPGQSYDPVPGQPAWPVPPPGMGSNEVHFTSKGGSRRKTRRLRKGGGLLGTSISQAFTRPVPSSAPPGVFQDMQDMWYGKEVGASPDQVQRNVSYQIGTLYPKTITY